LKAWGGRFAQGRPNQAVEFGRSIEVDQILALDDIAGSIAHVHGLLRAGLLTADEATSLEAGLVAIRAEVEAGPLDWDPALEDIHLNIEMALTARVGAVGGKLHTGRSRNDQVATDLRLWSRRTVDEIDAALLALEGSLVAVARREIETVMPGTTHTQPAQPVLLAHHLLAYVEMLERDRGRFNDARRRLNISPLGSGAIAGAGFHIDREAVARELGFDGVTRNSIDAVGDRDFVVELLAAAAIAMTHLSRLAEELVWWSNPAFGYVRLADEDSTGSSMMPNKRNPDPAELVRGRSARVIGELTGALTMLKGLPAGYQRDLQEDKGPLFDALSVLATCAAALGGAISRATFDRGGMAAATRSGFITATSVADTLTEAGIPFRVAHHVTGSLVASAEARGITLEELEEAAISAVLLDAGDETANRLAADASIPGRVLNAARLEAALARFDVIGGTAPSRVAAELERAAGRLAES
jgi:argininosuccinate lyase